MSAPLIGACCDGQTCSVTTQAECVAAGHSYFGDGTTCSPNPCLACSTYGVAEKSVQGGSGAYEGWGWTEQSAMDDLESQKALYDDEKGCICYNAFWQNEMGIPNALQYGTVSCTADPYGPGSGWICTQTWTMTCDNVQPGCCRPNTVEINAGQKSLDSYMPATTPEQCSCMVGGASASPPWKGTRGLCLELFLNGGADLESYCAGKCVEAGHATGTYSHFSDFYAPFGNWNEDCWYPPNIKACRATVYCCCDG